MLRGAVHGICSLTRRLPARICVARPAAAACQSFSTTSKLYAEPDNGKTLSRSGGIPKTMNEMPSLSAEDVYPVQESESTTHLSEMEAFQGMSSKPFPDEVVNVLLGDVDPLDIEIKPDGLIYLPEIKYRRILNRAFKPGGWALAPRGPHSMSGRVISREYALFAFGRFVSQARGEQEVFDEKMLPTAMEGCKSNALMRCCKDLGIASELWDPGFIRGYKVKHCESIWVRHVTRNTKTKIWRKKGNPVDYPYEELR